MLQTNTPPKSKSYTQDTYSAGRGTEKELMGLDASIRRGRVWVPQGEGPEFRKGAGQGNQPGSSEASKAVVLQVPGFRCTAPSSTLRTAPTPPSTHPALPQHHHHHHHSSDSSDAWLPQPTRNSAYLNKHLRDWPLSL